MKLLSRKHIPLLATFLVTAGLYTAAALRYEYFFTYDVAVSLLRDNAALGIMAVGMTFVILSGGIDLSVGAVLGCSSVIVARLLMDAEWHPLAAMSIVLAGGTLLGAGMGGIIHAFRLPPFLVTLAGMFFARGLALVASVRETGVESIGIMHDWYDALDTWSYENFPVTVLIFAGVLLAAFITLHFTRTGRNVYAVGGSEPSALLMGLPVARTKVLVYAISGCCAALAGIVNTFYTFSGNAHAGTAAELDAIAAVVIGGTLLSGGVGTVVGTLLGVLLYGIIQSAIMFEGTLNSWWTKIAIGGLLLAFVLLQKAVQGRGKVDNRV